MFTGIITHTGLITAWSPSKSGGQFSVKPQRKFTQIKIGESIAINGCCLTVVSDKNGVLTFDVSDETMRKTAMYALRKGSKVNLERAMRVGDRLGGHFVLGHVDGVGKIKKIKEHKGSVEFVISYPKTFAELLIEKGSVTVDGVSLTVCDLKSNQFGLYIIPHTLNETHLGELRVGDPVNLEFDVLGKYVFRREMLSSQS